MATGIKPSEILFVGNSDNDEWAYMSGCKTLCVNAYETDTQDKAKWHNAIIINDLREILKYIGE